jgi:hypothetical protein
MMCFRQTERNGKQMETRNIASHNERASKETKVVQKTVASVLAALTFAAFSVTAAYALVTTMQPSAADAATTAEYCDESMNFDGAASQSATCGEDKDKDKEGGGSGYTADV